MQKQEKIHRYMGWSKKVKAAPHG